jgi:hypothetical protein
VPLHIIIDGYNFIRQSAELAGLDRQDLQWGRDALVDLLAAYKKLKPHKITIVFDGTAEPALYGDRDRAKGIDIRFSKGGQSADDLILEMAQRERAKALVVSSDREVMNAAEAAGATPVTSADFDERVSMARYMALKGGGEPTESSGWVPTTRKKGPRRRLSKRRRQARSRARKL